MLVGPPGAGKSMLAARLIGILPPLDPAEVLEVSMIASVGGRLAGRPAVAPAAVPEPAPRGFDGGHGRRRHQARPGEISLAHLGVLFLDELPEFGRAVLESLRQPLEAGGSPSRAPRRMSPIRPGSNWSPP